MNERELRDRALFDNIAIEYSQKDIYCSSRNARKMRLLQTLKRATIGPNLDMLEVGCGVGYAAEHLAGYYQSYTGIDYSKELITYANATNRRPNVTFYPINLYDFKLENQYDVIFLIGVLHHMVDIPKTIETCSLLLNPGGYLVVNEPQPANMLFHFLRNFRTKIDSSYSNEQEELEESRLVYLFQKAKFVNVMSFPQGFLSTPFAEVVIRPQVLSNPLSKAACATDVFLERYFHRFMKKLSWNIIVRGQKESCDE